MCKPCSTATTAAECRSTEAEPARRRRARKVASKPNRLEEFTALGRAMADAALVFDQAVNFWEWNPLGGDGSIIATNEGYERAATVKRAAVLCEVIADMLAPHFPKRPNPLPECNSDGNTLRRVAEQMDRLDHARGYHDEYLDDRDREYTKEELYPHLLRERSERDPAVCPLCGGEREFNIICVEADEGDDVQSWMCNQCEGDVKKARRVLKAKRVNPDKKPAKKPKKAKVAPTTPTGTISGLPWFGELDCRTDEEIAADEAAGVPPPVCFLPNLTTPAKPAKPKPRPKPRQEQAPALVNRLAGIN